MKTEVTLPGNEARGSFPGEKESPITASVENPTLFLWPQKLP